MNDAWRFRRRFMLATTAFSMVIIAVCLWRGEDLRIYETAITMAFGTISAVLGFYIGGATWEDINKAKSANGNN
jgi:hypothetical protein